LDERRQVAGVVDVRVREHDGIDLSRAEGEVAVDLPGLAAAALVKATIEEQPLSVNPNLMHRTCNRTNRTPKSYSHKSPLL
jgi:hypothetical protein